MAEDEEGLEVRETDSTRGSPRWGGPLFCDRLTLTLALTLALGQGDDPEYQLHMSLPGKYRGSHPSQREGPTPTCSATLGWVRRPIPTFGGINAERIPFTTAVAYISFHPPYALGRGRPRVPTR